MLNSAQLAKPPIVDRALSLTGFVTPGRHLWDELIGDLCKLHSLEDDWDGQGAEAPGRELVGSAIKLACLFRDHQVAPAHYATAGVNGTVHFEWIGAHRSVDIEVIEPGLAEVVAVDLLGSSAVPGVYRW